jgi:hypothetical protein
MVTSMVTKALKRLSKLGTGGSPPKQASVIAATALAPFAGDFGDGDANAIAGMLSQFG